MGYLLVENFGEGLDTRRSLLTTAPGALLTCKNAHITRGKEIEKRKKFAEFAALPAGTFGMQAAGNRIYVFGSSATPSGMPATITYQQLKHKDNTTQMSEIIFSETFNGQVYAIAKFVDGSIYHYFNGSRITSWDNVVAGYSGFPGTADNSTVALALATQIDNETLFVASSTGTSFTIIGPSGKDFTATLNTINGGAVNNQTLTQVVNQTYIAGTPATGPITSVALAANDLKNQIDADIHFSATVVGTTIQITGPINEPFTITTSTTQGGTQTQNINIVTTQAHSGSQPQISEAELVGAFEPNDVYEITLNIPALAHVQTFSVTCDTPAVGSQSKIITITVGGTFELDDKFIVTLAVPVDGYSKQFFVSGSSSGIPTTAKTFGDKVYATTNSTVFFSETGDATKWQANSTNGSGSINLTTQDGGSENLTGMGLYQNRLAVFSKNNVQIWAMDANVDNNVRVQTLSNIGTFAPKSIVSFGDIDLFFLSDSGIRSLRARDSSNAATIADIGTSIDTLVQSEMAALSETVRNAAVSIIEPTEGRFWLSMGDKIYVFSYFPASKVSAWSTYELGFNVSHLQYLNGRVYARSGDTIYLYGGLTGQEYDDCEVIVELPYLDGGKPAHTKTIQAIDLASENSWQISIGTDISSPGTRIYSGTVENSSYMIGRILHFGIGTHVSARLVCQADGYARLGNMAIHYTLADAE